MTILRSAQPYFFSALFHGVIVGSLISSLNHNLAAEEFQPIEVITSEITKTKSLRPSIPQPKIKTHVVEEAIPLSEPPLNIPAESQMLPVTNGISIGDEKLVTQGLKPLNLDEVNRSIKRTVAAVEKNVQGKIKLKLLVDETGKVREVTPENVLGFGLDEVAIDAAWRLHFIPARIDSRNVALETYYTVKFKIDHQ